MANRIKEILEKLNPLWKIRHLTAQYFPQANIKGWLKKNRKRICIILGIVILIVLSPFLFSKITARYDTYIKIPQHFTAQERDQIEARLNDILNDPEKGKNNAGMYNNIGILRSSVKDYRGAIRSFRKAKSRNPDDARFDRNMGITYKYMGDYNNAEKSFQNALALMPTQPEFWIELGELYIYHIHDPVKAKLFYLQVLERNINNIDLLRAYANFSQNIDMDFHEAYKYWMILTEKDPNNRSSYLKNAADAQERTK